MFSTVSSDMSTPISAGRLSYSFMAMLDGSELGGCFLSSTVFTSRPVLGSMLLGSNFPPFLVLFST